VLGKHVDSDDAVASAWYVTVPAPQSDLPSISRRAISICVDDFGLHEGINRAAMALARSRRISAISCLVDGPAWEAGAGELRNAGTGVEVGLHLNFTEDFGQGGLCQPLWRLLLRAWTRALDGGALRDGIRRQIERFESGMGRMPDFVDGHQHVHQLPGIREALIDVLRERCSSAKPWLRATCPAAVAPSGLPLRARLKSQLIRSLGGRALDGLAAMSGFRQNGRLLGVYTFDGSADAYLRHAQSWLPIAREGDLLMCHPSVSGPWQDPILAARLEEYRALSSQAFLALLEQARVEIRPLSRSRDEATAAARGVSSL
jgi:predicted glycoside hydrolase/deacetylase ChbG (UPF0249 family)